MINFFKRLLLRIVFGRDYDYMARSLTHDPRAKKAKLIDFVVRKDGLERRIEGDWLRNMAKIVSTPKLEEQCRKYVEQCDSMFPKDISRPILCENCQAIKTLLE
jgi:hypothetical protein